MSSKGKLVRGPGEAPPGCCLAAFPCVLAAAASVHSHAQQAGSENDDVRLERRADISRLLLSSRRPVPPPPLAGRHRCSTQVLSRSPSLDYSLQSKEQLRAMRAQRTAALAAQQQQQAPPPPDRPARAGSAEEDARSMPPPPPRVPSARSAPPQQQQQQQHAAASYHADSQGTRLHDSSALVGDAHAEPSINQRGSRGSGGPEEVRSAGGSGLPGDFFEQAAAPRASGAAAAAAAPAAEQLAVAERVLSLEGSTGTGAAAGAPAGADVTSSASRHADAAHAASGVPAGFFQGGAPAADSAAGAAAHGDDAGTVVTSPPPAAAAGGDGGAAPLPRGALPLRFFRQPGLPAHRPPCKPCMLRALHVGTARWLWPLLAADRRAIPCVSLRARPFHCRLL